MFFQNNQQIPYSSPGIYVYQEMLLSPGKRQKRRQEYECMAASVKLQVGRFVSGFDPETIEK